MEINAALRAHQQDRSEMLAMLHTYLPLIVERFFDGKLPLPAVSCEQDRVTRLGTYRPEDGLALCHRINVNACYLDRPPADVLGTLAHELGHLWEHVYGKPSPPPYHSKAFRDKMQQIGIPCDSRGKSLGMHDPFVLFLGEIGVRCDSLSLDLDTPETGQRLRGTSKLVKWSCGCTNIRAAVEVHAQCLKCQHTFARAD